LQQPPGNPKLAAQNLSSFEKPVAKKEDWE
jgi:hypothetical protein